MKVELDERGKLTISAETAVESFALSHWFTLWGKHEAVLQVTTVERGERVFSDVKEDTLGGGVPARM